jgi:phosphate transport system substrate-binding protein
MLRGVNAIRRKKTKSSAGVVENSANRGTNERKQQMNKSKKMLAGLAVMAVAAATNAGEANKIVVDGSTTVGPIAKAFAEYYMDKHPDVNITVSESGSGNGAKSLINAACDVATMSRPMKNSEIKAARDAGVLPIEHIIAMDGIAVVVHPSNPLANITIEQLRDIYTGKIRNWKALGGPDQPIVVISRDTNSGTYETFETLVMNREKLGEKVEYVGSNGAVRQRVMSTPAAIGYVGLAFTDGVKALTVNGVEASAQTVANNKYPISRPLYMYTNGRPKQGTPLCDFVNLSATPEGRKIIEEKGFVPKH